MTTELTQQAKASAYVAGLRELANFIEAHPSLLPDDTEIETYRFDAREEAAHVLFELKPCEKDYSNSLFKIFRKFGPITLSYLFYRSQVCTRKVVGVKHVEASVIPEYVIEAHDEEIVEWDCNSLLSRRQ